MKSVRAWLNPDNPISGWKYFLWGISLFTLKYPLDLAVANYFGVRWSWISYFSLNYNPLFRPFDGPPIDSTQRLTLWLAFLSVATPFIIVGVFLTLRRLKTVRLAANWVWLFFLPFLNSVFFLALANWNIFGSIDDKKQKTQESALSKLLPNNKPAAVFTAIILGGVFNLIAYFILIKVIKVYGTSVFWGAPFTFAFATVTLISRRFPVTIAEAIWYSVLTGGCGLMLTIATFLEGIICVAMALPLTLPISVLGGVAAWLVNPRPFTTLRLVFILPAFLWVDLGLLDSQKPTPVVSRVTIDAPRSAVWKHVIEFPQIEKREKGMFDFYVPKLQRAVIEGSGVGALRRCIFDTGEFLEPIQTWAPPEDLTFGVESQLPGIGEYVTVTRGQFLLKELPGNRTEIIGTTWFKSQVLPGFYWDKWVDYFIHGVHMRALEHIKSLSEV